MELGSDSLGSLGAYLSSGLEGLDALDPALEFNIGDFQGLPAGPFNLARYEVKPELTPELPSTSGSGMPAAVPAPTFPSSVTEPQGETHYSNDVELYSDGGDDAVTDSGKQAGGKRRRRNRTERQQILNRLAQQRYRQRKKEKVQQLQSSVSTLQSQLDRLSVLENENAGLRASNAQLAGELAGKDCALKTQAEQLRQAATALKQTAERCAAAERSLAEANQTIEAQRAQLRCSSLHGMDPQVLSDRLLAIIKEALAEAARTSAVGGVGPSVGVAPFAAALESEVLVASISRSLTNACRRELMYAGKQPNAAAEAPSAIPVSCC